MLIELDKACFQRDTAYREFKDLPRRAVFSKVFNDKQFNFAKYLKFDGYMDINLGWLQWLINFR